MKQHRTLRRGLGILLALTMGLCLLAATALAETQQTADFTIGDGNDALNRLKYSNPGKVEWDGDTNTLTLKGVNFAVTAATAVKLPADSTIVLADGTENTIESTNKDTNVSDSHGILVEGGDLTITGSGTLNVTGGAAQFGSDGISVKSGGLTITGGTVNAYGSGNAPSSTGIYSDFTVKVEGGTVKATGSNSTKSSYGIRAWGVEISGGTVTAIGGNSNLDDSDSVGIWAQGAVTISDDAKVTATGGKAQSDSCGFWISSADVMTITGGTVIATGSNAEDSYGIRAGSHGNGKITISGGHVTVKTLATTAMHKSALYVDETNGGALDLSGYTGCYWRTGPDDYYNDTAYPYSQAHTYVEFAPEGKLAPDTTNLNDLPKTGDNSNVLLWIALLLASGLGVTGAVVYGRRSKTAK